MQKASVDQLWYTHYLIPPLHSPLCQNGQGEIPLVLVWCPTNEHDDWWSCGIHYRSQKDYSNYNFIFKKYFFTSSCKNYLNPIFIRICTGEAKCNGTKVRMWTTTMAHMTYSNIAMHVVTRIWVVPILFNIILEAKLNKLLHMTTPLQILMDLHHRLLFSRN